MYRNLLRIGAVTSPSDTDPTATRARADFRRLLPHRPLTVHRAWVVGRHGHTPPATTPLLRRHMLVNFM